MFNNQYVGQSLPSINLENIDYKDHEMILTSPRSIYVCKQLNANMEDLYFYNFYEFRNSHPELLSLSIDKQKAHYFHLEQQRQILIDQLIKKRREIINQEKEKYKAEEKQKEKILKEMTKKQKVIKKPAQKGDITKEIEKNKLMAMLETNLRNAFLQKEEELRAELEERKAYDLDQLQRFYQKEKEKHDQYMEEGKRRRNEQMLENQRRIKDEYDKKEQEREQKMLYNKMFKDEQAKRRNEENLKKLEDHKQKLKEEEEKRIQKYEDKKRENEEKQNNKELMDRFLAERRKKNLDQRKMDHEIRMNQQIEQNKQKINNNIQRFNEKQENIKNNIYLNQLQRNEMLSKKKKEEETIKKYHQENLDWNNFQRDKLNQEVMAKQAKSELFRERNELEKRKYMEEKQDYYDMKEQQVQKRKQDIHNGKINYLVNKINERHINTENHLLETKQKINERNARMREIEKENENRRFYQKEKMDNDRKFYLQQEMKIKEENYEKNRKNEQKKRDERINYIKKQKEQKENIKNQFDELIKKNKGEIDIEKIKKLLPDDIEFHQKIERAKEEFEQRQQKQIDAYENDKFKRRKILELRSNSAKKYMSKKDTPNYSYYNTKSSNFNQNNTYKSNTNNKSSSNIKKTKKRPKTANKVIIITNNVEIHDIPEVTGKEILNENKIKYMLEDYQKKLMKDFLNLFNKEDKADDERRKIIDEMEEGIEKRRLEKIFAMQRGLSSDKIGEYNNLIDEKLKKYEQKLREVYEEQKNKI